MATNRAKQLQNELAVFEHYRRGHSLRRIAAETGLSHEGARKIIQRIEARTIEAMHEVISAEKVRSLAVLDHYVEQLGDEFERSREPRRRATQRGPTGDESDQETVTQVEERIADTNIVYCILACLDRKANVLGLNMMPAIHATWTVSELSADLAL